jgi:hypothetical protein
MKNQWTKHSMMPNEFWELLKQGLTLMAVLMGCQLFSAPRSLAADAITVRCGLSVQSVSISDLRQYAATGKATLNELVRSVLVVQEQSFASPCLCL